MARPKDGPEVAAAEAATAEQVRSLLPESMAMVHEERDPRLTADVEMFARMMTAEDRDAYIAEVARIRSFRKTAFGSFQLKLAVPPIPGYYQHWFSDKPGRVGEAENNGWSFVNDKAEKKERRVVGEARDGSPLNAYLMKIPMPFWLEDMARRHDEAAGRMEDIKKNPIRAQPGQAKAEDKGKFYSPHEEALSIREGGPVVRRAAQ